MNDIVKKWLADLYKTAIEEAQGAIANEHLWANGAEGDEAVQAHCDNIALQEEYIKVLEEKLAEISD